MGNTSKSKALAVAGANLHHYATVTSVANRKAAQEHTGGVTEYRRAWAPFTARVGYNVSGISFGSFVSTDGRYVADCDLPCEPSNFFTEYLVDYLNRHTDEILLEMASRMIEDATSGDGAKALLSEFRNDYERTVALIEAALPQGGSAKGKGRARR